MDVRDASATNRLTTLLFREQAQVAQHQRRVDAIRAAVVSVSAGRQADALRDAVTVLPDLAAVRSRVRHLAAVARAECLILNPATVHRADVADARRPVYRRAIERGVSIRAIHTERFCADPAAHVHNRWLTALGAQIRAAPAVPLQLVVVDRTVALVPLDLARLRAGAVEVHHPGAVAELRALFEQSWSGATPVGGPVLTDAERDLLRLLADGHTDESAGRKLGMSVRTVRRMMAHLSDRLGARSRFQAGLLAAQNGWL